MPTYLTQNYYPQGWIYGPPRCVILHSTRSGRADFDHLDELAVTVSWFQNPNSQASAHWVISPTDMIRMVPDEYPAWTAGYHNFQAYQIELTQPTPTTPYEDGHYSNLAMVCADYVRQGIPIVRIDYLPYSGNQEGFVGHQDTQQGRSVGKSDPGRLFDYARFFAELRNTLQEEEMPIDKGELVQALYEVLGTPEGQYIGLKRRLRTTAHPNNEQHGGGGGYTDADAVKAIKDKLE